MPATELGPLEQCVYTWIKASDHPITTSEILAQHEAEISAEDLRRAVWNLVDSGVVKYDNRWQLALAA